MEKLSTEVWKKIYSALHLNTGIRLKDARAVKKFFEGLPYMTRSGCSWRAVHKRYKSWSDRGVWQTVLKR